MQNPDRCPAEPAETAEAYLLGHLPPEEARAFEEHYITCPKCAAVVEETGRYVAAMKGAARRLRGRKRKPGGRGGARRK